MQILIARERGISFGGPDWAGYAIPLLDTEVEDQLWHDFFDKVYAVDIPSDEVEDAPGEKQRRDKIVKFQHKIQEQFRKAKARQAGNIKRRYKLRDVVHQPELPELRPFAIMEALRFLFRKRGTLRPEQRKNRAAERTPTQCKIRITVQRGFNLPQRRADNSSSKQPNSDPEMDTLECVVQARFKDQEDITPPFKGSSPAWNAPLSLSFQPPKNGDGNDWAPSNLLKVTESLHLNVFDIKVWEKSDTQGNFRKVEKRWLGNVRIPFTTILNNPCCRIDGQFELDSTTHAIGYQQVQPSNSAAGGRKPAARDPTIGGMRAPSSIQLCIALDPPLQQLGVGAVETSGRLEDTVLDQCVSDWIKDCKKPIHCRNRPYDAVARCLKRDWVLITRYVDPCPPPRDAYHSSSPVEVQMMQLCRFVSLIPFLEDWNLDSEGADDEIPSVWCTSKEFVVEVGAGDWEEHATLLCNFFLFLKKPAYLVFGSGKVFLLTRKI
jgi:hypothetical protein